MKKSKLALFQSVVSLLLCISMLMGTTFAWFTDSVTSANNIIKTGNLKIGMDWADGTQDPDAADWKDASQGAIFNYELWEPGYTEVRHIRIENKGSLALKYQLKIIANGEVSNLADVIDVYYIQPAEQIVQRTQLTESMKLGTLTEVLGSLESNANGHLAAGKDVTLTLALKMQESAGNEYQNLSIGANFSVVLLATQYTSEDDSFDKFYDKDAEFDFPANSFSESVTEDVAVADGKVAQDTTIQGATTSADIPAGVQVNDGTTALTVSVSDLDSSSANVTPGENEAMRPLNVHVEGVAPDNDVPMTIKVKEVAPKGLNAGNLKLYHVENGQTVEMTLAGATPTHNQFQYDPATGDITLYMATFSEVALVADTENAWNGEVAEGFASGEGTEINPYIIANADQLVYMGDMISNDNENYGDKHYKLIADINLGGEENAEAGKLFYPIGYHKVGGTVAALGVDDAPEFIYQEEDPDYARSAANAVAEGDSDTWYTFGGSFKGTFDGSGHTIANIYQNTWQLKGDYDGHYWNDAMGLFGYVNGGTVKNLTVDNFSSDGEFTPTGVIAAYAAGNAVFENIAITDCNPRVYNTGNGGIIGIAGDTRTANDDHITLTNITVDNSNKISALWGSWDVACGGLVGMYRGNVDGSGNATGDTISFTNCHVAAQIDVYNDVCANYQYYAYRYAGMIIGSIRHNTTKDGKTIPNMTGISASGCTVNYGDWNDYYYCEFVKNSIASYSEDYQFSRVPHSELNFTDSNGNGVVDANERASVTGCKHTHTAEEDKQAVYLPFHQLFTGYSWGVSSVGLEKYSGIVTDLDITEGDQNESVEKFKTKFTGDFLYRVGNQNTVSLGSLFGAKDGVTINNSGVYVSIDKVDKNSNVSGTFTANTSNWTNGTIQFSGTGVVKVTIQDYDYCKPTELTLEVINAKNITSATGTTSGGDMVLLCDVNTSNYVNYWDCTLYGNGFTYSLKGAPTAYNSKQGHGILITKNTTLDNLVIVGDVYNSYGAYTTQDYYNAAVDVLGDTVIQNCYISGCAAPVSTRANATISNTTLYGGTVANLIIKSGTVTLEDVTTANYDDGRTLVGMGIVIHSDATESAKLVLNGTLTQYNFISESKVPTDTYAKNLHSAMFGDSCSKYHFGTSPNRYVNTGIISLTALFNAEDVTDNANTEYVGTAVTLSGVNGYVYTQPNTSGSVNNGYDKDNDTNVSTTQGAVAPNYSFDYTEKNYIAKMDGSNDYCYEENGKVNISMDAGDTFNWDTSILTATKAGQTLSYTVSMNGTDYTGKSIAFNTAGEYEVKYTYTDNNNYDIDENGNIITSSKTYTKTVYISVAVIEAATKHAEFTFGSSNTASTTVTVGNNTYVMPDVSATSSTIGSTTVDGQTIYYPIVEIVMSDGKTSHSSGWYAYFPVFSGAVTITDYKDNGLGDAETFGSSTQSMPSGLSIVGDPASLFKYQSSSSAGTSPVVKNNILVYSSPSISAKRSEYNTVIQYSYQDNAGTTYYYYIGYHAPEQSYTSCVTPDTLVTLADGTQKRIDEVTYTDQLLVWDFDKGAYAVAGSTIIENHGYARNDVIKLTFEDGSQIKVVNVHGFFDADLNKWVDINADNAQDYVGHKFTRADGNGYKTAKLVSAKVSEEYVEAWSILTADHYNCILEGMFSITPPATEQLAFFEIGADMKYDAEAKRADIEKYGLFTYGEFAHLMTYEQFDAFNIPEIKIAVGKGLITYEEVLGLIATYIHN